LLTLQLVKAVIVNTKVRIEGLEKTLRILKKVEPDSIKQIRAEIRGIIKAAGTVSRIRSRTPAIAPLSGMNNNGPVKWAGARSITVSPLSRITGFTSVNNNVPLAEIKVTGGKNSLGFDYAELAGIRRRPPRDRSKIRGGTLRGTAKGDGSMALRGQGDNFIKMLEERHGKTPGRFAFRAVLESRKQIMVGIQATLDKYAESVNRKLR
jgi:hypothetical protein